MVPDVKAGLPYMDQNNPWTSWNFDVSSFLVLLSESEEFEYRLSQRRLMVLSLAFLSFIFLLCSVRSAYANDQDCIAAAPVAGLQSYLRSNYAFTEARGPNYISPYGCKVAPLRNMRLAQMISHQEVLKDGQLSVYRVPPHQGRRPGSTAFSARLMLWVAMTWILCGLIFLGLVMVPGTTWIGISISGSFLLWSMFLRIAEGHCIGPVRFHSPTRPHDKDAVIFMGRRNSCFVLEGSREDVSRWTGLGLEQKEDRLAVILTNLMRFGSLLQLLFIFAVIPNGTTWDQVGFILFNALGQLNLLVCGRLGARRCMESLDKVSETEVGTRTHVYGELLRKFGDGKWVETASLLPETDIWSRWRKLVLENRERDCKALYAQSVNEEECFNRTESAGSEWTNIAEKEIC